MIHKVNNDIVYSILEHLDCCNRRALSQTCHKLKWTKDRKEKCKEHSAVARWCKDHKRICDSYQESIWQLNGRAGLYTIMADWFGKDERLEILMEGTVERGSCYCTLGFEIRTGMEDENGCWDMNTLVTEDFVEWDSINKPKTYTFVDTTTSE